MVVGIKKNFVFPPIPSKKYFSIAEVSTLCGVKPHVLRYWESEFTNSKPSNLFIGFMDKHLGKLENKVRSKIEEEVFG